jgi:hypothetical protein
MQQHIDHDQQDRFPTDPSGLPEAGRHQLLELADGDTLDLRVGPVAKQLGDTRGADAELQRLNSWSHPEGPAGL